MSATKNKVNSGEILRSVMKLRGYNSKKLAKQMGYDIPTYVSNRVSADDLKLSTMAQLLEQMNYKIVICPVGKELEKDDFVLREIKDGEPE